MGYIEERRKKQDKIFKDKICKSCGDGELKTIDKFSRNINLKDGRQIYCKACYYSRDKKIRSDNLAIRLSIQEKMNKKIETQKLPNYSFCNDAETKDVLVRDEKINGKWYTIYPSKVNDL